MITIARLKRANHGTHFRALTLRDSIPASIDPFLGVDHAWMSAPTFPPHPHAGFSAVSYVFPDSETGITNRDSLGNHNLILPGGLHWTAAGRGVVHEEIPAEQGKTVHMLQIFVNLPQSRQEEAPFMLSLAPQDVPVIQRPGVRIRAPLGHFAQTVSPLEIPNDVTLLDISLDKGAELNVTLAAGSNGFVLPVFGELCIDERPFRIDELQVPLFQAGDTPRTIRLQAKQDKTKAVVFSGQPLTQPVYWLGPLALASKEALADAAAAYQRGEFGAL
jgi:redox-sensitive bicupin YhaK (pirin superfamily)